MFCLFFNTRIYLARDQNKIVVDFVCKDIFLFCDSSKSTLKFRSGTTLWRSSSLPFAARQAEQHFNYGEFLICINLTDSEIKFCLPRAALEDRNTLARLGSFGLGGLSNSFNKLFLAILEFTLL